MAKKQQSGPNYQSYVKAYNKKKEQLAKKGLSMRDQKLTETEFKFAYKLERQQMVKLVKEGKRKVVGNITQNLVSEQAYSKSLTQARNLRQAYKEVGLDISIRAIREGSIKAQEAALTLGDVYQGYVEGGMSSEEAASLVSQLYFGS